MKEKRKKKKRELHFLLCSPKLSCDTVTRQHMHIGLAVPARMTSTSKFLNFQPKKKFLEIFTKKKKKKKKNKIFLMVLIIHRKKKKERKRKKEKKKKERKKEIKRSLNVKLFVPFTL